MKNRPWIIALLAGFYFLAPFGNLLLSAVLQNVPLGDFFTSYWVTRSKVDMAIYFGRYFIAGWAILSLRWWSYPVFIGTTLLGLYRVFESWQAAPNVVTPNLAMALAITNVAIVGYFLIPAVRLAYFEPMLRWWERSPRYRLPVAVEITGAWGNRKGTLGDISQGGAFLQCTRRFEPGEVVTLHFNVLEREYALDGRVAHTTGAKGAGCGVEFVGMSDRVAASVRNLIQALDLLGVENNRRLRTWGQDFNEWLQILVTTGRGFTPLMEEPFAQVLAKRRQAQRSADWSAGPEAPRPLATVLKFQRKKGVRSKSAPGRSGRRAA